MDEAPIADARWIEEDPIGEDGAEPERVGWDAPELLALAGACVCTLSIAGFTAGAVLLGQQLPGPTRTSITTTMFNATSWSDYVAALLIVVVGLTWWGAHRWSGALEDGGTSEGEDPMDADGYVDELDVGPAGTHLRRLRPLASWASLLLVVTATAGVVRVVASFIQARTRYDLNFAGNVVSSGTDFLIALTVAIFGLAVAYRATRLCLWWDYFPGLPDLATGELTST
ncbi:MAG: hypothetical protein ACRDZR_14320 [Acidimicrobiales bacterium]